MKDIILIKGVPFEYERENLTYDTINPIREDDARQILDLSKKLFEEKNLFFFLWWGTLLGAVRDHGVIPGDEDVDCGITDEKKLIENIPFLYENGLKVIRHIPGKLYSFRSDNDCYIDFYVVRPLKLSLWALWCYSGAGYVMEKKLFKNFKEIEFLGGKYLAPEDTEAMLERLYGKTWKVPQSRYLSRCEVDSYYLWRRFFLPHVKHYFLVAIGWKYWQHLVRKNGLSKDEFIKNFNDNWAKYKHTLSITRK